jgi:hypothetical protein
VMSIRRLWRYVRPDVKCDISSESWTLFSGTLNALANVRACMLCVVQKLHPHGKACLCRWSTREYAHRGSCRTQASLTQASRTQASRTQCEVLKKSPEV